MIASLHSIFLAFPALLCSFIPASASPNGRYLMEGRLASIGMHRAGSQILIFELLFEGGAGRPPHERLQVRRLNESGPPVVLWEGERGSIHSPVLRVAAGPGSGTTIGRWFHGGGTRYLHLWSFPASIEPVDLEAAEASEGEVQEIELAGEVHHDAADPFPFYFQGRQYLLGTSWTGPITYTVWISPLPFPPGQAAEPATLFRQPEPLQVRKVAEGAFEPRVLVARYGSGVVVTVLQGHPTDAAVQIYRSKDLETWTLDEDLSSGLRAEPSYAVLLDGGTLWLATTRGEEHEVVVLRRGLDEPEWKLVELAPAAERRARSSRDPLWLLGAPTPGGRPELVLIAGDGTIAACSL